MDKKQTVICSQIPLGILSLALATVCAIVLNCISFRENMPLRLQVPINLIPAVLAGMGLVLLHRFKVTREGIYHDWLGLRYRFTPWEEIIDISRATRPRNGAVILLTRRGARVFTPDDYRATYGMIPDSLTFSIEHLKGNYLVFENRPETVTCLRDFYGVFSYDVTTQ